ncbi:hypothetical protein CLAFUW4_06733 [Fulvia fulva]|nr:hypothetical protein CLAFUR4_06741 [Fulvia fulva]WPV16412.1 hypothetical protein CLAFUW4_06733 [Fulvia fulva]WPV31732.1 hypothetical protein CLAFUW7_06732 [Fulvia fulva]
MAGYSSKAEEAHMSSLRNEEEAPPAYEDLSRPPSNVFNDVSRPPSSVFSDASLTDDTTLNNEAPSPARPFPLVFNLYSENKWKEWKTRRFHLGEHADQPTNAVIFTTGWKGTTLSLHQGPEKESPAIALGTRDSTWSKHSAITLPRHPAADGEPVKTQLRTNIAWKTGTVTYSFSIEVLGHDEKFHEERFEWRLSHEEEVRDIDKRGWGYKLVRLSGSESGGKEEGPQGSQAGSSRSAREHGTTSDGKEVVSVFADRSLASKNKVAIFAFVGGGATGQFGERWAVLAVVTFLRVWQSVHPELSGGV